MPTAVYAKLMSLELPLHRTQFTDAKIVELRKARGNFMDG